MAQEHADSNHENQHRSSAEPTAVLTAPVQVQSLAPPPFQLKASEELPELESREPEPSNFLMTTGASAAPNDSPSSNPNDDTNQEVSQQKQEVGAFQLPVQRQVSTEVAPFQLKASSSSSHGMPEDVRGKMENAFKADFSNVNIHQDSQSATDVGALAYTQGNDVHFAPGQFKPDTQSGQELIGHELTHVVQQREGRVKPTTQAAGMPVNDDKGLEGEADDMGRKAAAFQMKEDPNAGNTYPKYTQSPSSTSIQTKSAPIQMTAAPGGGGAGGATASGGGGEQLNLGDTSTYLSGLASSQPVDFISNVRTAPAELGQIYSQQQSQAQQSLPVIEQPTGLPAQAPVAEGQAGAIDETAGAGQGTQTQQGEEAVAVSGDPRIPQARTGDGTETSTPQSLPNQPGVTGPGDPRVPTPPAARSVNPPASTSVTIDGEAISYSAGERPEVDTSGEADPQQLQTEITTSTSDIQQDVQQFNEETRADFGENDIFPQVEPEMMEAQVSIETSALPSIEELGEIPDLDPEVAAGFNAQARQHLDTEIAPHIEQHEARRLETESSAQTEWTTYNQSLESETTRITAEQEAQQTQAQTEVDAQRELWIQENEAVRQEFEQNAEAERINSQSEIEGQITSTNQEVQSVLAQAETDAASEATTAETEAREAEAEAERREEQQRNDPMWKRAGRAIGDAVSSAWNWLRDRFNDIINGLRAAITAIIDLAKDAANRIIDAARNVIVGMIQAFGTILQGLVNIAFAAFPEIRDRINAAIDTVVHVATEAINMLADALKAAVAALLDTLGAALNFLLSAYQAFVNTILDAIELIAVGLYEIMQGINNLVQAARQSPEHFWGQLSEEILGMDVTQPLPNERPALVDNGQSSMSDLSDMGMDSATASFMNQSSYSESDFMVEPVVSGEVLPPEIMAQLASMGDGEYEFGESNDDAHSMDAFREDLLGYPMEGMEEGAEMDAGAMDTAAAMPAMGDDEMVGPFASTSERLQHVLGQFRQGVADWWAENQVKVIAALIAGLLGLILINILSGGAVMAALPLIMQLVGAYFLGEAIVRMTSYFGSYLGSAWPGDIGAGAVSLARGFAIGAFELVSSLLFSGKAAIRGIRNGARTVARQGVRGAAKTGARNAARGVRNSARANIRAVGELGGIARTGARNTLRNGRAVIRGVGRGFSSGARSIDDLGRRLARQFRFRKFKFSIRGRNWRLFGKMNPWILMANGRIQRVDADSLATTNGHPPRVGDVTSYTDEAGRVIDDVRVISPRQRNFEIEIQSRLDRGNITPEEAIVLRDYNMNNPSARRVSVEGEDNFDRVLEAIRDPNSTFNPVNGRTNGNGANRPDLFDDASRTELLPSQPGRNVTPSTGTPEHTQLVNQRNRINSEIETAEADIDTLSTRAREGSMDADAVEYRQRKNDSFERRHPETEHRTTFENEYDEISGGDVNDADYLREREELFQQERQVVREQHSSQYDRGKKNEMRGDISENIRGEAVGVTRREVSDQIEVTLPNGTTANVAPDFNTSTGFIEMKSGRITLTRDVENQILRYAALAQQEGQRVTYELLGGASDNVLEYLNRYGINYIDYTQL